MDTDTPRGFAVDIVNTVSFGRAYADELLTQLRNSNRLGPRDLGFVREIVLGTIRRRLTLDCVLNAFSARPLRRIQPRPLSILRTALYQILFLDRVPASAATDEAVSLAGERAGGFVNAVLRNCVRALDSEPCDDPSRSLAFTGKSIAFRKPVFPHPDEDHVGHLAAIFSHPEYLVGLLLDTYGEETARQILQTANGTPPLFIRTNTLQTDTETLTKELHAAGRECHKTDEPEVLLVDSGENLFTLPAFQNGFFTVQDLSTAKVVALLEPQAGETILDACAAPGGKTSYIAEATADGASIVACDISARRLERLKQNLKRLKIRSVSVVCADLQSPPDDFHKRFDKVLLDVPCSNSGVLRRRPEARYRITAESLGELTALQGRLLEAAAECVVPGGMILYSTCSVLSSENEFVVERFTGRRPDFHRIRDWGCLPVAGGPDGAYAALLQKEPMRTDSS